MATVRPAVGTECNSVRCPPKKDEETSKKKKLPVHRKEEEPVKEKRGFVCQKTNLAVSRYTAESSNNKFMSGSLPSDIKNCKLQKELITSPGTSCCNRHAYKNCRLPRMSVRHFHACNNSAVSHYEYLAPDPIGRYTGKHSVFNATSIRDIVTSEIYHAVHAGFKVDTLHECFSEVCQCNMDSLRLLLPKLDECKRYCNSVTTVHRAKAVQHIRHSANNDFAKLVKDILKKAETPPMKCRGQDYTAMRPPNQTKCPTLHTGLPPTGQNADGQEATETKDEQSIDAAATSLLDETAVHEEHEEAEEEEEGEEEEELELEEQDAEETNAMEQSEEQGEELEEREHDMQHGENGAEPEEEETHAEEHDEHAEEHYEHAEEHHEHADEHHEHADEHHEHAEVIPGTGSQTAVEVEHKTASAQAIATTEVAPPDA